MSTVTRHRTIGPKDHGKKMRFSTFIQRSFEDGWLYELARGVIDVTEVPKPKHGRVVRRLAWLFLDYDRRHPGVINYSGGGGECRLRLPGMQSDRHPDQAVYLTPEPSGDRVWTQWYPALVVEVVSRGGKKRDYVEKREEYLRFGVLEYWILDLAKRKMLVLSRVGDTWEESHVAPGGIHRTPLLPGLEVSPDELFGPVETA